jgi:hypothetical protein
VSGVSYSIIHCAPGRDAGVVLAEDVGGKLQYHCAPGRDAGVVLAEDVGAKLQYHCAPGRDAGVVLAEDVAGRCRGQVSNRIELFSRGERNDNFGSHADVGHEVFVNVSDIKLTLRQKNDISLIFR